MIYGVPVPSLSEIASKATFERREQQRKRRSQEFLRGPIPIFWLAEAVQCGKLALAAGLLLWFRKGCQRSAKPVTVSERQYKQFGLSRQTFARGLIRLEAVGLVGVERKPGMKPRVTILIVEPT